MRPNPKSAGDTDYQNHGVLDVEKREDQGTAIGFKQAILYKVQRKVEFNSISSQPVIDPFRVSAHFVKVAANNHDGRYDVEDAKYADSDHESFEFFGLIS